MAELEPAAAPAGGLTCPWCGSGDVAEIAQYGSLLMTAQWFCDGCGSAFERIRHRGSDAKPDAKPDAASDAQPAARPQADTSDG
jgi:hypothetical protein